MKTISTGFNKNILFILYTFILISTFCYANENLYQWEEYENLPFQISTPTLTGKQMVRYNNWLYISGGEFPEKKILCTQINEDNTLSSWKIIGNLPGVFNDYSMVIIKNFLYLITGANGLKDVFYTKINTDGKIGQWKKTIELPFSRQDFAATTYQSYIYVSGGNSGGSINSVLMSEIENDGSIKQWKELIPIPEKMQGHSMLAVSGYLYVFSNNSMVYFSKIKDDGSIEYWNRTNSLPYEMSGFSTVNHNRTIYIYGEKSYRTYFQADGSLSDWSEISSLPLQQQGHYVGLTEKYIFIAGGNDGTTNLTNVYRMKIPENIVLNHKAQYFGQFFFDGSSQRPVNHHSIPFDGEFFQEKHYWKHGTVWWKGTKPYFTVKFDKICSIHSFIVQADNNDSYRILYHLPDSPFDEWKTIYDVPAEPLYHGMRTRCCYSVNQPVDADAIKVMAVSGDDMYSIGEILVLGTSTNKDSLIDEKPSEYEIIGDDVLAEPDEDSKQYIFISSRENPEIEDFNYQRIRTKNISISGKVIIFEKDHENNLYVYNKNTDIKKFNIYAEKVIVRSPLILPQTQLTIHAKELRFEDFKPNEKAYIATTPVSLKIRPAQFENGKHGLDAGIMNIYIDSFYSDPGFNQRLIAKGGNGQAAGLGQNGQKGASYPALSDNKWHDHFEWHGRVLFYSEYKSYYSWWNPFPCPWKWEHLEDKGTNACPTSGKDAYPAGVPGNAGKGGAINTTINISKFINNEGGNGGETGFNTKGGFAGTPRQALHLLFSGPLCVHDGKWQVSHTCIKTNNGKDSIAPKAEIQKGHNGQFSVDSHYYKWIHPNALKIIIRYARDTFLFSQNPEAAKTIYEQYINLLSSYQNDYSYEWNNLHPEIQTRLIQQKNEMVELLLNINNQNDYFGNPSGWTPVLSFEVTKHIFDQEIERSIPALYLFYYLNNKIDNINNIINTMPSIKEKKEDELDLLYKLYIDFDNNLITLKEKSESIKIDIMSLQNQLINLEQQLLEEAEKNVELRHKIPEWKQFVRIASAICMCIPGYGTVVGTGLNLIANIDIENPIKSFIKEIPDVIKSYNEASAAQEKIKTKLEQFNKDYKKIPNLRDKATRDDFFKQLSGIANEAKPLGEQLMKASSVLAKVTVPQDEINAELETIKKDSKEFKEITEKISRLMVEKQIFMTQLTKTYQDMYNIINNIENSMIEIAAINDSIVNAGEVTDYQANIYLNEMEKRQSERLIKYQYFFAKAYEYRLLKPYPKKYDLDYLFERFRNYMASDKNNPILSPDEFSTLITVYYDELSKITKSIIEEVNNGSIENECIVHFNLETDELAAINEQQSFILNPVLKRIIPVYDENVRIKRIEIDNENTEIITKGQSQSAHLALNIAHPGTSFFVKDNHVYKFVHKRNCFQWETRLDQSGKISEVVPSPDNKSLLCSLINCSDTENTLMFSRPGAFSDLIFYSSVYSSDNQTAITANSLQLKITYSYTKRKESAAKILLIGASNQQLSLSYKLNKQDIRSMKDGKGNLIRMFNKNDTITVTAPDVYGPYKFKRWNSLNYNSNNLYGIFQTDEKSDSFFNNDNKRFILRNYALYGQASDLLIKSNTIPEVTIQADDHYALIAEYKIDNNDKEKNIDNNSDSMDKSYIGSDSLPVIKNKSDSQNQISHTDKSLPDYKSCSKIVFNKIPDFGNRINNLHGNVNNMQPNEADVLVYTYVDGWRVKPSSANPKTKLRNDGSWECDLTTQAYDQNATHIAAFLVPKDFNFSIDEGVRFLPELLYKEALAQIDSTRYSKKGIALEFTNIPLYGNRIQNLKGIIHNNNSDNDNHLVVYIYYNKWKIKPSIENPFTIINADGSFYCDITTEKNDHFATKIAAFLFPKNYNVPLTIDSNKLPEFLYQQCICEKGIVRISKQLSH